MNTLPRGGRPNLPSLDNTTGLQIAALLLQKGANTAVESRASLDIVQDAELH